MEMRNITLISTYHAEKGVCKVSTLHQILEKAQPDVIFLEIPHSSFEQYSNEVNRWSLEFKAVNRYLENHSPDLVPVDVLALTADLNAENERLHRRVDRVSPDYRSLVDWNSQQIEQVGFAYLNSKSCIDWWSKVDREIRETIEYMGQAEELMPIHERWNAVIEHREVEMMKNIQNYSHENKVSKGVFLLGAAHRGEIIEKAGGSFLGNSITLNWNFENYEGLIDSWQPTHARC